jgi:hypothetical protein
MEDATPAFDAKAAHIRRLGGEYGGDFLQATAHASTLLCRSCGELPPPGEQGWISDWLGLCQAAIRHVHDNPGHQVIADAWHAAVYAKETS